MKKTSLHIITLFFGLFYLFSGIVKIIDIDYFLFLIRSYPFGIFLYLALLIPVVEIIIAILLLLGIRTKQVMFFSLIMVSFFTLSYSLGNYFFSIDDCGCFGGIDFLKMPPIVFFIRNGILIGLSLFVYNSIKKQKTSIKLWQLMVLICAVLISSIATGVRSDLNKYLEKKAYNKSTIDAYQDSLFINKNIHETILSEFVETSKDSSYIVFIFSYKCSHCINSANTLNSYIENDIIDHVKGIAKGTRNEKRRFSERIKPAFNFKSIKYIEMNKITAFYPLSFYVENDTIRFKVKGNLPPAEKFEELYKVQSKNTQTK